MPTRYDKKGKIFTEKVTKDRVRVTIQTCAGRLTGHLHVPPDRRMRDDLNKSTGFLAVTNGSLLDEQGQETEPFEFLAINKEQIIWVIEEESREPIDTPGSKL
jgi:hypothetical protein